MRALAQRLATHRRERRLQRPAQPARRDELVRERLECVEPDLPVALALELQPLVVPVRQQLGPERGLGHGEILRGRRPVEQPVRQPEGPAQVDLDIGCEPKVGPRRLDELASPLVQTPERGAQARAGAFLRGIDPERARDVEAQERPLVQRDEREQALGAQRHLDAPAVEPELERVQQRERRMGAAAVRGAPTWSGCDRGHALTTRSSARSLAAGRRRDGIPSHPQGRSPYLRRPYSIVVLRVKAPVRSLDARGLGYFLPTLDRAASLWFSSASAARM